MASNPTSRIDFFDSLRGLAVFLVFNVHYFGYFGALNYFSSKTSVAHNVISTLCAGHFGVDLFFVISGYLIARSLAARDLKNIKCCFEYLLKRAARLLPAHFAVLLICCLIVNTSVGTFISNLFFFNSGMNYVSWSLGYEWAFYTLVVLSTALTNFVFKDLDNSYITIALTTSLFLLVYFCTKDVVFTRTLAFPLGMSIYQIEKRTTLISQKYSLPIILTAFLFVVGAMFTWGRFSNIFTSYELEIIYLFVALSWFFLVIGIIKNRRARSLLSGGLASKLGLFSYSFYLVHALLLDLLFKNLIKTESLASLLMLWPLCFVLCCGAGLFLYYLIEKPALDRSHKILY